MTTRPLLCLVTDRRRLADCLNRDPRDASGLLLAQIEGAIHGGVDLVQIREHDLDAKPLASLVSKALDLARDTPTRVVVNDRIDVVVAAGAHGVHLREAGPAAARIRATWPSLTIGRSVHSPAAMRDGGDVDYWIAGTMFPTASKPGVTCLGVEGLARLVNAAAGVAVLAIGGITATTLGDVVRAGASGVAAIGAFMPPPGASDVAAAVDDRVRTLRFAFDSASSVP